MSTAPVRRLDSNHDMTFGRGLQNFATLAEATGQRVRTRLLLILGEFFLDTTAGVPWFQPDDGTSDTQPIMGVPTDLGYTEATIKATILATDGIASITSFSMTLDSISRRLFVSAIGPCVDGGIFSVKLQDPGP